MLRQTICTYWSGILLAVPLLFFFQACDKTDPPPPDDQVQQQASAKTILVEGMNSLGIKMLEALPNNENGVVSPFLVSKSLSLLANGGNDQQATSLKQLLKYDALSMADINQAFDDLAQNLQSQNGNLNLLIGLWLDNNKNYNPIFRTIAEEFYNANLEQVNFQSPSSASSQINNWFDSNSQEEFVQVASPLENHDLYTGSALTFNHSWQIPFDQEATQLATFDAANITSSAVVMMHESTVNIRYTRRENTDIAELFFENQQYSLIFLVPDFNTSLDDFIDDLDIAKLQDWLGNLEEQTRDLYIPRFTINTSASLTDLGILTAQQNLAAIASNDVNQSEVYGSAAFEITEDNAGLAYSFSGDYFTDEDMLRSEAFAVTGPFVFLVRDNSMGSILLMGKIQELGIE